MQGEKFLKIINVQTKIRPCSLEFLFKKNKRACTSIRYTRVLLNSFTFHDKGSFDLWRSFELGNAIKCKILFVFTTSEITAPILSSLPPCRSSGSSRITFLGAFIRKCVWSIKQIGMTIVYNSIQERTQVYQLPKFVTSKQYAWYWWWCMYFNQSLVHISSIDMMSATVVIGTVPW